MSLRVLGEVGDERIRQRERYGQQRHPDGTGLPGDQFACVRAQVACDRATDERRLTWRHILEEEVCEAFAETDPELLRAELIQVAAVAVQWIEALDARK